ncbi:hypothetical protein P1J78_14810 [Psychromarinibacter sp. C21-152]|uniref:TRAP-type C4-dicarboxylate transport system, substrate-binding protein n=1 Tax=Psychromarinibacter sediminicola TaxID=3033385 RepID=A0AAE3NPZ4_9RHOB|nr:hypothetical protein [Psychromarinibacter sediminicola]MDF0602013.1 hypothetical protein [Psychromarinibacter sediminicola]
MSVRLTAATLAATTALAGAQTAAAEEYIYSSWFGTNHTANVMALGPFFEKLAEATDGEAEWKLVPGAQLASGPGTPEAVGNGLVDGGIAIAPYQPRLMAATNTIFSNSLLGKDTLAAAAAMNEAVLFGCPECREEYRDLNAVGFAGYATTPYVFMCATDVQSVDDLKGLKVRSSGGGVSISEIAGATPVSMSPGEATTALERGTLDCVLGAVSWLKSYGYQDVVETVVDSPMGTGGPPLLMFLNRDIWNGMSPEVRAAHIELAPELVASASYDAQLANDARIVEAAVADGLKITPDSAEFQAIMEEHDRRQRDRVIEEAKAAGVENPEEILDFYLASYDRWKTLLDEEGRDRETFVRLLWDEIYSKVDPEAL